MGIEQYNLLPGYNMLQTILKANEFLNNPVAFIEKSVKRFPDRCPAAGGKNQLAVTPSPDFINYVLK
jgi:hypothetical protein